MPQWNPNRPRLTAFGLASREIAASGSVSGVSAPYMRAMNIQSMSDILGSVEQQDMHTVLVVEDETMVRMPIAEFLRDCGYNVVEAGDASEAIAAMEAAEPVNLVFTDVRMPGSMDGFDLAAWFESHYPSVPVLLTSGYNARRNLPAPAASGGRFIEKPYSQTQVARRIADLLAA